MLMLCRLAPTRGATNHCARTIPALERTVRAAGGELKAFYLVTGQYNAVAISELPNDEAADPTRRRWRFTSCTNNFAQIHKTLRVTPAMEAGVADHVWSLEEIAELAA